MTQQVFGLAAVQLVLAPEPEKAEVRTLFWSIV
jgi:hypothetical protein